MPSISGYSFLRKREKIWREKFEGVNAQYLGLFISTGMEAKIKDMVSNRVNAQYLGLFISTVREEIRNYKTPICVNAQYLGLFISTETCYKTIMEAKDELMPSISGYSFLQDENHAEKRDSITC